MHSLVLPSGHNRPARRRTPGGGRGRAGATVVALSLALGACTFVNEALWPSLRPTDPRGGQPDAASAPAAEVGPSAAQISAPSAPSADLGGRARQLRAEAQRLLGHAQGRGAAVLQIRGEAVQAIQRYEIAIAGINTRLAVGTTPANPALRAQGEQAALELDRAATTISRMTQIGNDMAGDVRSANAVLQEIRNTFSLAGALESDHQLLVAAEDDASRAVVLGNRQSNDLAADVARLNTYIAQERRNLGPLAQAINAGERYAGSAGSARSGAIESRPIGRSNSGAFSSAPVGAPVSAPRQTASARTPEPPQAPRAGANPATGRRPLVVIRFDRPNPSYAQALYTAVSRSLERKPDAMFDLVAVAPSRGAARRGQTPAPDRTQAAGVMRTLTDMGLPANRINSSWITSGAVASNEVHLYVR